MQELRPYSEVISHGTYLEGLKATRDVIAQQIELGVMARDLASLTRRLLEIQREINELDVEGEDESPAERAERMRAERRKAGEGT